jgi:hypothetical protein
MLSTDHSQNQSTSGNKEYTEITFRDRIVVLATMHQKETVMAPLLERELGLAVIVSTQLNTDRFGTFTREMKRPGTQLEAARAKARTALQLTGKTIAIASEGSFGPHPLLPSIPCNRELVLLLDQANQLELVGEAFSCETNYSRKTVSSLAEAMAFAESVGFPSHGLIVARDTANPEPSILAKGITTEAVLMQQIESALKHSQKGTVILETDMRALYNPTRMKAIASATQDLIRKIKQRCPMCDCPGFEVVERQRGLPCLLCHSPTDLALRAIYQCQRCRFKQDALYPDGVETADPGQCPFCNP